MQCRPFSALTNTISAWWTGLFWTGQDSSTMPRSRTDQAARPPHVPDRRVDRRRARRKVGPAEAVRTWLRARSP